MLTLPIAKPPWTQLGKRIESMIRRAIFEYQLLDQVNHLAIALSGGKDSLTLLYMLAAIRGAGVSDFQITAFHVNGEFSCGSSIQDSMLSPICKQLGIDFVSLEQKPLSSQKGCYPCSRERRRLLFEAAKKRNIKTIAFGHHRDDSISTLLMNLLHKGEFAANLAKIYMKHYDITLIRPMIYLCEQDIITFSGHYKFNRALCKCPLGQNSMRKKTGDILKYLEKYFPNARSNLASASRVYGSDKASQP